MNEAVDFSERISGFVLRVLHDSGITGNAAIYLKTLALLILTIIFVMVVDFVVNKILLTTVEKLTLRSKTSFDDHLVEQKATKYLGHIVPALLVDVLLPVIFEDFEFLIQPAKIAVEAYIYIFVAQFIQAVLRGTRNYLLSQEQFKDKPIQSIAQLFVIITWLVVIIMIFSTVSGRPVTGLLTGLGALSAVILLVFKDSILGFVGSIQLAYNDMVRVGDWVSMPKYGADGDVISINLNTVKVQNWDRTITTIPTYAFIADSFKNWRGMSESGGRRIKRNVRIKISTVKFCDDALLNRLKRLHLLKDYIESRNKEIEEYNKELKIDKNSPVNGRHITNIGLFRAYVQNYIDQNPKVKHDMTAMVRQLEPDEKGIPLEIYCFSAVQEWVGFEGVMADIFDHIFASVQEFDLEIFEQPTGTDVRELLNMPKEVKADS